MDEIILEHADQPFHHPFYQKNIVFTGALSVMTRSEAARRLRIHDVNIQGAVLPTTHFVILGQKRRGISTKQQKAEHLLALGFPIQIIEEDDFLWLLSIN